MITKKRIWEIVEVAKPGDRASRTFDVAILTLISLNVLACILGTVQSIQERWNSFLNVFEIISVVIFTLEYSARFWSCTADYRFRDNIRGRIRHAFRVMSIVDFLAILPFYLPFLGVDFRSLRVLRLFRIFRIAKAGRYYSSLSLIKYVFYDKKEELILTSTLMGFLLIVAPSVLYYCENVAQPDAFSSIPATMWWAVASLTTVGYGDMYPVTLMGKFCAGIIAILGIGMFALPTGILGAGFVQAIQKKKEVANVCPHCGKQLR